VSHSINPQGRTASPKAVLPEPDTVPSGTASAQEIRIGSENGSDDGSTLGNDNVFGDSFPMPQTPLQVLMLCYSGTYSPCSSRLARQ